MLILPVRLPVVTNDPVGKGRWGALGVSRGNFSVKRIVEALEETVTEVHVANRINTLRELYTAWELAVQVSPLVLNALHMPLVDHNNNSLLRTLINGLKEVLVTLIHKDLLQAREVNINVLDIPVDKVRIYALLRELVGLTVLLPVDQVLFLGLIAIVAIP